MQFEADPITLLPRVDSQILLHAQARRARLDECSYGSYIALMVSIGVREAKNRLSKYLRMVQAGETVLITDRGRVVAQLQSPSSVGVPGHVQEQEALYRLARAGRIRVAQGAPASADPAMTLPAPSEPVDLGATLERVREDRR